MRLIFVSTKTLKHMKTLSQFKAAYQKAKTQIAKGRIMTNAELNLSHVDFQEFVKFQTNL